MIVANIYWDGLYQGQIKTPVRLKKGDTISGTLFKNIITGERFVVLVASHIEVSLKGDWQNGDQNVCLNQDITVKMIE